METRLKLTLAKQPLSVAAEKPDGQKIKFVNPNVDNYETNIRSCAARGLLMAPKMLHEGETAIVCGSGPSLKDPKVLEQLRTEVERGAVLFACKAAIKYLHEQGIVVHYGVSMDPGAHIADPRKIAKVPGVTHIIASTSDPELFDYLLSDNEYGPPVPVWVFHSACGFTKQITDDEYQALDPEERKLYIGIPADETVVWQMDETTLYAALFPDDAVMCGGFNVVNRAVSLAQYMGARKIILAGADSGWRDGEGMYCDGLPARPGVDMRDGGRVDGSNWNTRPDMLASAVALARIAQDTGDQFVILGDTLPASLALRDANFLNQVASY